MASSDSSIAFIGLGVMGYPMAVNLRTKMDPAATLYICDVNQGPIQKFIKDQSSKGPIEILASGAEAVEKANLVITMLPGSPQVKSVYLHPETGIFAENSLAKTGSTSKIVMECGTIETDVIIEVGKVAAKTGTIKFVDAPVSGGPMGAEDGTLAFMVGCSSPEIFPAVKAVLSHMGKASSIFMCGEVGAGSAFKLINNYLSAITSLAASEALNIGSKMGLNLKLLSDVINVSGGQCWVTSHSNPVPGVNPNAPASRDYQGGFRIELCAKVLKMGMELADNVGARSILSKPALDGFMEAASDERYKGKDARVVYKWLNEN